MNKINEIMKEINKAKGKWIILSKFKNPTVFNIAVDYDTAVIRLILTLPCDSVRVS